MRPNRRSFVFFLAAYLLAFQPEPVTAVSNEESGSQAVKAQVDAGKLLYAGNCANCHGSAGKGANGPALADRNLSEAIISDTILHGRVGTPMPPFKDELDPESQGDVIAYVLWLTSGGSLPQSVVLSSTQGSNTSSSPNSSSTSVAIGKDSGRPAVGAALFFDPTKLYSCQTCHSYSHMGGPIGPDLANSSKSPLDIYRNLVHADVKASGFPGVAVGFRAGGGLRGIKSQETEDAIMVFDLSSLPPVERTIPKTEILTLSEIRDSGIYDHTQLPFTKQNLLDLSGFLGAATSKDLRKHLLN